VSWIETRWGRVNQGRRELGVALAKDVSVEKLADLIGLKSPSLWGWKAGSRPKEESMDALEKLFLGAGLTRYTKRFLDYGPEGDQRTRLASAETPERKITGPGPKRRRASGE
jgi:transcriptional regulator with XRE-family HTH domain